MKLSIKDFFGKYDQILRELRIWSHLLRRFLMENFIFCAVILSNIYGLGRINNPKSGTGVPIEYPQKVKN